MNGVGGREASRVARHAGGGDQAEGRVEHRGRRQEQREAVNLSHNPFATAVSLEVNRFQVYDVVTRGRVSDGRNGKRAASPHHPSSLPILHYPGLPFTTFGAAPRVVKGARG